MDDYTRMALSTPAIFAAGWLASALVYSVLYFLAHVPADRTRYLRRARFATQQALIMVVIIAMFIMAGGGTR